MLLANIQLSEKFFTMSEYNHTTLIEQDKQQLHPLHHVSRTENTMMINKADGVYLHTTDDRKILDAMAGLWNVNVGYGNTELPEVAKEQMLNLAYTSGFAGMSNPPSAELADKLAGFFRPNMNFTYFTSGGSEASDTSFKTARFLLEASGQTRTKPKSSHGLYGYHGITMAAMSATGISKISHHVWTIWLMDFIHIPNPNAYRYPGELNEGETVAQAAARALEETILSEGS